MAAQPDILGLYPHSAPDGTPIPFDIVRPHGLIITPFAAAAIDNIPIPASAELLVIQATHDCIIAIGAAATVPAPGAFAANHFYITPGVTWILDHNAAAVFGVIRASTSDGTLYINAVKKWKDLRKSAQFARA